jgi:hypothetical protein
MKDKAEDGEQTAVVMISWRNDVGKTAGDLSSTSNADPLPIA